MPVTLNWDTYASNFARFSKELLCDDKLSDVVLVSEDLTQFQAHKIILCASSDLFRTLLVNNPHPNPMLFLKGVKQEELQSILEFVYLGETTVLEEDVQRLLTAARDLEISDLEKQGGGEVGDQTSHRAKKRKLSSASMEDSIEGFYGEMRQIPGEGGSQQSQDQGLQHQNNFNLLFNSPCPGPSYNQTEEHFRSYETGGSQGQELTSFNCEEAGCHVICPSYHQYKKHLKTEHNITRFHCKFCDFRCENRNDLNAHIGIQHQDDTFDCLECRFKGKNRVELSKHIITAHRLCRLCEYRAPNRLSLENHLKTKHSADGSACKFCDFKSPHKSALFQHVHAKHKKKSFKCEKCDYQTGQESQLVSHRYVHIAANV